jgi:hypothetical protein
MSIMRTCGYSLGCLACVIAAFFVQPRRSFAKQNPDPQTPEQIQVRDALHQRVQAFKHGQ